MLHALSQKPKPLAWILVMVLYAELAAPLILKAEVPRAYKHAKKWEPAVGLFEAFAPQNPEGLNSGNLTMPTIKPSRFDERQVKAQLATGPGQPEMQAFSSVNNTNMVDLFSGDFSKSIPLMDVGGYPINLSYRSGITMDQEASWVGLGFSINPGTINRNMRGIPDDFNGMDSVKKVSGMKDNKTIGVTVGADAEIGGTPFNVGAQYGVFHNNYKGWGLEYGLNASINAGIGAGGELTSGLSLTNNSQEGVTLAPSFTIAMKGKESNDKPTTGASFTTSLPFNSRSGMKSLQLGLGMGEYVHAKLNKNRGSSFSSEISFASPSYTPASKNIYTSSQFSFTGKIGGEIGIFHGNLFISGYVSKQKIADEDTLLSLPAYGYLNYQDGAKNKSGMLDFNREKELVYREKPAVPHIALPIYTYDVFSITGEGIGGMFRGYRGDIGFVYDPLMKSKDISGRLSVDFGAGNLVHGGTDLNVNRSYTQDGPWMASNTLKNVINFRKDSGTFEASYFRNPGEKSVNSKQFYDAIGGDDLVSIDLYQPTKSSPTILATNSLTRYKDKKKAGNIVLKPADVIRKERDKRSQVISYLNAKEASIAGLSKYIESYNVNQFQTEECASVVDELYGNLQTGLITQYYEQREFKGRLLFTGVENEVYHNWGSGPEPKTGAGINDYSVRWAGKIKVPVTGAYVFKLITDDGGRLFINDTLVVNNWSDNAKENSDKGGQATANLNLIKDEFYDIKVEYYENKGKSSIELFWSHPGQSLQRIPAANFYQPFKRDTFVTGNMIKEKRLNSFRKSNHISEISVLNNDGRRYVYGIPVYNLKQTEATYAINPDSANKSTALAKYTQSENSVYGNKNGKDNFVSKQEVPAYAHSFLLTGIVSPDYVDLTGNGITDDDLGDGIRFNYSKVYGITNPFKWRAPYAQDSVTYNESLKTDNRDDRASYVYGEKELWFLHSIISKSMIATFVLDLATPRKDLLSITESGKKQSGTTAKCLKEINLYNKADFNKNGVATRPIKTVHFKYSYRLCKGLNSDTAAGKLTLDSVWFTYNGNNKGKQNPYVFYYTGPNPRYNARSYDRWGNFKDALQNPGSVAGNVIQNDEYPYSLQDSLLAAKNAAAWALDSISLPSGGSIKVDYESDDYAFVQNKRAMQLFKLAGLGTDSVMPSGTLNKLYNFGMLTGSTENLYVYITVPTPVTGKADVYYKYLSDIKKLYFKLFVKVPPDEHGSGYEYVSCYADLANSNAFGMVDANTIWLKLKGISLKGDEDGNFSPLAKAAIQFIRLNLPSKAYPGSEVGDNMDLGEAVKMLASMTSEIGRMFSSFDKTARENSWCSELDLNRTFIRLNSPEYKKYGGGHRVKRIKIYDNWNKMTGQRPALYGQEYHYSTTTMVNGSSVKISSGVACYEPGIGGEENPLRVPIEYAEKVAPLAPVTMGYSEEPLGESLYPSPSVGYSKVQVRTINYKKTKSANGLEETRFYTAYDFPTITDRSIIDGDTKKRFSPRLSNFLRINARHFLALSQGFKVELNDMHGKMRSQASYAETDFVNPIKYTENIYKVQNRSVSPARLANEGIVMKPDGTIDTAAIIGKDVELMVDMKEQVSISLGFNISPNVDVFTAGFPPLWAIPSLLNLVQRQENQFRTAAVLKVVNRFGILDSVIQMDKGSKISTKDLMYDSETGDAILTRTQNEFNDPIYNFNYPAHWAYDGMGMAYKNINLKVNDIDIKDGKITRGMPVADSLWFSSGDEILVAGKVQTDASTGCSPQFSTFPYYSKIWAIDTSILKGGKKAIYFIDKDGKPYNGFNISLNIIRSGRRNMSGSIGAVTSLYNPLSKDVSGHYTLKFNDSAKIINTTASTFKQDWKVSDRLAKSTTVNCLDFNDNQASTCSGLNNLFKYLSITRRLFIKVEDSITVSSLINDANGAGYSVNIDSSEVFLKNANKLFYAITSDSIGTVYKANLGDCILRWTAPYNINFYKAVSSGCNNNSIIRYNSISQTSNDTITKIFKVTKSITVTHSSFSDPVFDTTTQYIVSAYGYDSEAVVPYYKMYSCIKFDSLRTIPRNVKIFSVKLDIYASPEGHTPAPGFSSSGFVNAHEWQSDPMPLSVSIPSSHGDWDYSSPPGTFVYETYNYVKHPLFSFNDQDFRITMTFDDTSYLWKNYGYNFATNNNELPYNFSTFCSQRHPDSSKHPTLEVIYIISGSSDTIHSQLSIESCKCDTVTSNSCLSLVKDTAFNPYKVGVLGNWRTNKSYVYFGERVEHDPASSTNIRNNGVYKSFQPFWVFENDNLRANTDSISWVWNSEIIHFNTKGLEIENKDPLGRYNAGLYGYGENMPSAVIQNGRYRESAFEGFEDYNFRTQNCDTACPASRHMDFGSYSSRISTLYKHTGKSSLRLNGSEDQAGIAVRTVTEAEDAVQASLVFTTKTSACVTNGLKDIKVPSSILLPAFSPLRGKQMVISAWVKEEQACNCVTYVNNHIRVFFGGSNNTLFSPLGPIIEGWQRYEGVFTIPDTATSMGISLEPTGSTTVYYDDIRIHPYNANMKSFVYNPIDLRLMAELDENNYASFYEYDDDGTLIRVKKETQRGIKTIKETRSALTKE